MQKTELSGLVDVVALSQKTCPQTILAELMYASKDNFVGTVVDGYDPKAHDFALLERHAAEALCKVQTALNAKGYGLKIFDTLRPKRAVKHFVRYSEPTTPDDPKRKSKHYPNIEKNKMFELGYVAEDSQHCYGHTIDLTIINLSGPNAGHELDMGTIIDFMDEASWPTSQAVSADAQKNRKLLAEIMQEFGFVPYDHEWWHFSYHEKVFTKPFDFVISPELKGLNVGS